MGNAPLPRPPIPTPRRVVIPIAPSSRHWFATDLVIHSPLAMEQESSTTMADTTESNCFAQREETPTPPNEIEMPITDYPPQFQRHTTDPERNSFVIPPEEYQDKLQALQRNCLREWKGGKIQLGILVVSCLLVVGSFVAWMFPAFASSRYARHPFIACAMGVTLLAMYALAFRWANQCTLKLFGNVEELFWFWKGSYRVRVQLKRVSHWTLPTHCGKDDKSNQTTKRATRSTNCFCLVMILVEEEDGGERGEAHPGQRARQQGGELDNVSLGTVHSNESMIE